MPWMNEIIPLICQDDQSACFDFRIATGSSTSHPPEIAHDASSALNPAIPSQPLHHLIILNGSNPWLYMLMALPCLFDGGDVGGEEVLQLCSGWVALPKLLLSALNSAIPSQPLHPLLALSWSNPRFRMLIALLCLFDGAEWWCRRRGSALDSFIRSNVLCFFFTVFSAC